MDQIFSGKQFFGHSGQLIASVTMNQQDFIQGGALERVLGLHFGSKKSAASVPVNFLLFQNLFHPHLIKGFDSGLAWEVCPKLFFELLDILDGVEFDIAQRTFQFPDFFF